MNILNTVPKPFPYYFAIGNTPPVCLTQDLPPEQEADILLLGCGDARNVLFTSFADNARKIDVTCCDIEPMIHARNVLLYTLLINDESNQNVELIWNIYYHWKIDGNSLKLLETQIDKLLTVSDSIDQWHSSVYGSSVRFCDERSLAAVRSHWTGFTLKGLSPLEKDDRLKRLQATINKAKSNRHKKVGPDMTGYHALFPAVSTPDEFEVLDDLCNVVKKWWDSGIAPSTAKTSKPTHLNPVFLFSPNRQLTVDYATSPLGGIPLSTAYVSINEDSVFFLKKEGKSSLQHLVDCAKSHFIQWAPAFRSAVKNGSVVRIFSGDALGFCFTLRNCQLTGSASMNLFCHNKTSCPLVLHRNDYGNGTDSGAPVSFNVVDTSNLIDYLGPLNLIPLASSLLKHHVSSSLYTEMLASWDFSLVDRVNNLFDVDLRSMSLLLGLVPPDLFTNATNSVEEYSDIYDPEPGSSSPQLPTARSRLRWRRFGGYQATSESPRIQVKAEELAKFLEEVYDEMLKVTINPLLYGSQNQYKYEADLFKMHMRPYNSASFAFLLSILKATVITDWDKVLTKLYSLTIFSELVSLGLIKSDFVQDMILNLHVFGIDSRHFIKPNPSDIDRTILTSVLPKCQDLPDQLCVTVRVPRKHLSVFSKSSTVTSFHVICSFEGRDTNGKCYHSFASLQIVFGKWGKQNKNADSCEFIEEDTEMTDSSDMFVSVMVPTSILTALLLQSEKFVPLVKCGLKASRLNTHNFGKELGKDLCFSSSKITSKDVRITQFMSGIRELPTYVVPNDQKDDAMSIPTVVHFSITGELGKSEITSLVQRVTLKSEEAKAILAMKSSAVEVSVNSPLIKVVSIGGSLEFKLEFPVPVSANHKVRVARTSSYVEVEARFFDPLKEDSPTLFLFPCYLMKIQCGVIPVPWTSMHVDLDVMPALDLDMNLLWLVEFLIQMHSRREFLISTKKDNLRVVLKTRLITILGLYAGFQGRKANYFSLEKKDSNVRSLILPTCLRLDLANNTIVLDCALIPFTDALSRDPVLTEFLEELSTDGFCSFKITEDENRAWKAMLPAFAERCRTWQHKSDCEYVQTGEVPLSEGLNGDEKSPICSCGIGNFPVDYLKEQIEKFSTMDYILKRYATRAAISPIFAIPYVEDCNTVDLRDGSHKN